MKKLDNIRVDTTRLKIEPVSDTYKVDICNEFTAEVTKFMPFNPTGDLSAIEDFLQSSLLEMKNGTGLHFCIILKETNEFLGCCGIYNIDTNIIEVGLWVKKTAQEKGYGTETVEALIDFAEQNLEYDYLVYPVDKENLASRAIPVKFGFLLAKEYPKKKSDTKILNILEFRKQKHGR